MKKLTESEKRIVRQEIRRAFIIREAKKQLNEADFGFFIKEMTDYENNMVIKESDQEFLYEGLWDRFKNMATGLLKKAAPDNQEKLKDLTNQLDFVISGDLASATERGDKAGIIAANSKAKDLLKQIGAIDPQAAKAAAEAYKIEAAEETGGAAGGAGGAGGEGDGKDAPEEPTGDVKQDAQAAVQGMENPKAKGILGSIYDSYKYAFAANASMWEKIYGWIANIGRAAPQQQAQQMQQVQQRVQQTLPTPPQTPEEAEKQVGGGGGATPPKGEDPEVQDGEDGEGGEGEPLDLTSVEDKLASMLAKQLGGNTSKQFKRLFKKKYNFIWRSGKKNQTTKQKTTVIDAIMQDIKAQLEKSKVNLAEGVETDKILRHYVEQRYMHEILLREAKKMKYDKGILYLSDIVDRHFKSGKWKPKQSAKIRAFLIKKLKKMIEKELNASGQKAAQKVKIKWQLPKSTRKGKLTEREEYIEFWSEWMLEEVLYNVSNR